MRLIKLSTDIFVDENDLNDYFDNRLAEQKYKFHFGDQISSNGIHPDEVVLFSYQNELRYIAKAKLVEWTPQVRESQIIRPIT